MFLFGKVFLQTLWLLPNLFLAWRQLQKIPQVVPEHLDVTIYDVSVLVMIKHLKHSFLGAPGINRLGPRCYHPDVVVKVVGSCTLQTLWLLTTLPILGWRQLQKLHRVVWLNTSMSLSMISRYSSYAVVEHLKQYLIGARGLDRQRARFCHPDVVVKVVRGKLILGKVETYLYPL